MLGANGFHRGFLGFGRNDSLFDRTIVQVQPNKASYGLGRMSMLEMLMMIPSSKTVDGADYSSRFHIEEIGSLFNTIACVEVDRCDCTIF